MMVETAFYDKVFKPAIADQDQRAMEAALYFCDKCGATSEKTKIYLQPYIPGLIYRVCERCDEKLFDILDSGWYGCPEHYDPHTVEYICAVQVIRAFFSKP